MSDEFAGSPASDPPGETGDPLIGRTVAGKFAIEAKLGQGAMGAVYRARQLALEKVVAIKVLNRERANEAGYAERFRREAKAASRLDHPNSIRVFDFGQEPDGLLYLAMEYVEGRDLRTVLSEIGPLPAATVADILAQVLAALAVAHDQGVLHRDLKPENVMLLRGQADDGRPMDVVKVCDFGIAKIVEPARTTGGGPGRRTTEGFIVGTPEYMSPEQARGEAIDGRSDLYSVGVVLYELLVGHAPFEGDSPLSIVLKHLSDPPEPPSSRRPGVDAGLEAVCLKALQKFPAHRFQTAREMRQAIRSIVAAAPAAGSNLLHGPPRMSSGRPYRSTVAVEKSTLHGVTPPAATPRRPGPWVATATIATLLPVLVALVVTARRGAPTRPATATASVLTVGLSGSASTQVEPQAPTAAASGAALATAMTTAPLAVTPDRAPAHDAKPRRGKAAGAPSMALAAGAAEPASDEAAPPAPSQTALAVITAPAPVETPPAPAVAVALPVAAEPPPPKAPAYDLGSARVEIALARNAIGATSSSITRAISEAASSMTGCYRTELPRLAGVVEGTGTLHVETDGEGVITDARWSGPFDGNLGRCLAAAVSGRRVANVDTGSARADVPLTLRAH